MFENDGKVMILNRDPSPLSQLHFPEEGPRREGGIQVQPSTAAGGYELLPTQAVK